MTVLRTRCPAKVNLTLEVRGKLPTGYHVLRSIICPISLYDDLELEIRPSSGESEFRCVCSLSEKLQAHQELVSNSSAMNSEEIAKLSSEDNLAAVALRRFFEVFPQKPRVSIEIRIAKRIPWQAGLGGGSSNAAAVLRLLSEHYRLSTADTMRVYQLAYELGSDVPAKLSNCLIFVDGTGNKLANLAAGGESVSSVKLSEWGLVMLKPPSGMETKRAYRLFGCSPSTELGETYDPSVGFLNAAEVGLDQRTKCAMNSLGLFLNQCRSKEEKQLTYSDASGSSGVPESKASEAIFAELFNDFERVVNQEVPQVAESAQILRDSGCGGVLLAGSGSTVVGFCSSLKDAVKVANSLCGVVPEGWFVEVAQPVPRFSCEKTGREVVGRHWTLD